MDFRIEKDTLGEVQVPAHQYWGAQTERSRQNFKIGPEATMPKEIIRGFAYLKKAAAYANYDLGVLSLDKKEAIGVVCDEILLGKLDDQFPLVVWQTGSGTQSNMNVNEVIARRVHVLRGGHLTDETCFIHPNDDVNKSQSSNDTFPTAMHIAGYQQIVGTLLPSARALQSTLHQKSQQFKDIVKMGRTHLMDATPLTLGQEFSAYEAQVGYAIRAIEHTLPHLSELALGGTAVGTGLNAPVGYDVKVADYISKFTGIDFVTAPNKFEALATKDAFVETHGAIRQLAVTLFKIANDIRLLACGPRSGIGEIILPANEPGSSIMPGKVNPTQCEALTMVCAQVFGNDATIAFSGSQGHFQLNVFKPVIAYNFLQSVQLLSDACTSFDVHCVQGIEANQRNIDARLNESLMLITALNPHIGYERAAQIAKAAHHNHTTLREEAIRSGWVTEDEFDQWVRPEKMVGQLK
ncbi:MAG: class II fumarate hydratase [Alcaligenaceae bacterium]|nr:class II fumarate hydratase [Alcaligenaceae bacterium]